MTEDSARTLHRYDLPLRQIQVGRFMVFVSTVSLGFWLLFFILTGSAFQAQLSLLAQVPNAIALVLFWQGLHLLARIVWLVASSFLILVVVLYMGPAANPDIIFFAFIGLPFLLFSWKSERNFVLIFATLLLALSILGFAAELLHLREQFWPFEPSPPHNDTRNSFVVRVMTGLLILTELGFFMYMTGVISDTADEALNKSTAAARSKGEFLANMSHEIRTPMNGVIGMIEILESLGLDDAQNRVVGTIRNSAFSLLRIIDDILDASKMEAGKLDVELSRVELRPLIEAIPQTFLIMADERDVKLGLIASPDLPEWVFADSGRLRQILLNIMSNSIKYSAKQLTGRPGRAMMEVMPDGDGQIVFRFIDDGIGMDQETQQRLFKPFAQGEMSTRRQVGGTGLGLVISQSLIKLMGGTLELESELGKGTEVTVRLPLKSVKGPRKMPDLSGLEVKCLNQLDAGSPPVFRLFVKPTGRRLDFGVTAEDFTPGSLKAPTSDTPIFLLAIDDMAVIEGEKQKLKLLYPNAKFILFSTSRYAHFGRVDAATYLVQMYPMRASDLYHAMAVLSGRIKAGDHETAKVVTDQVTTDDAISKRKLAKKQIAKDFRILVVEDNEINQVVLSNQLEILGYPHVIASNGQEGLEKWRSGLYDLVLSDCHMPLMDGFEMTAKIRETETNLNAKRTPIIAVTANALQGEAEKCLAAGMDAYLAKPVEIKSLGAQLETLLTATSTPAEN